MLANQVPLLNPPGYPKDGTYADLLQWHLFVWGTRPEGRPTKRDQKLWNDEEFKLAVFEDNPKDYDEKYKRNKNYLNWIGKGEQVAPVKSHPKIAAVLFGEKPIFEIWSADLKASLSRSSPKGNNKLNLKIEEAIAQLVNAGYGAEGTQKALASQGGVDEANAPPASRITGISVPTVFPSWLASRAAEGSERRIDELTEKFFGRRRLLEQLDETRDGGNSKIVILSAAAGVGKSAAMAVWKKHRVAKRDKIVCHFISGKYSATTEPTSILAHIAAQISNLDPAILAEPFGNASFADWIHSRMSQDRAPDDPIVLVLDGLDEVQGPIEPFLPLKFGIGWYVYISCRVSGDELPPVLTRLIGGRVVSHIRVPPLEESDIMEWLASTFEKPIEDELNALTSEIHAACEGVALFASFLVKDAAASWRKGSKGKLMPSWPQLPSSFEGYVKQEIEGLDHRIAWTTGEQFIFALLTLAKAPMSTSDIDRCLAHAQCTNHSLSSLNLHALRPEISRWFTSIGGSAESYDDQSLVFCHPILADVFGKLLGYRHLAARDSILALIRDWKGRPSAYGIMAALDHFIEFAQDTASSVSIVEAIQPAFDYQYLCNRVRHLGINSILEPLSKAQSVSGCPIQVGQWRQLIARRSNSLVYAQDMHRDGLWPSLFQQGVEIGIIPADDYPKSSVMVANTAVPPHGVMEGHTGTISDIIELPHELGLVSSSYDGTLRTWRNDGSPGAVLNRHNVAVKGLALLPDDHGFVSWSEDGKIIHWDLMAKDAVHILEHRNPVSNVMVFKRTNRFLSWSKEGNLKIWSFNGKQLADVIAHPKGMQNCLLLPSEDVFLTWGKEGSLKFWNVSGQIEHEFKAHDGAVLGALWVQEDRSVVSWGEDGKVRVFSRSSGKEHELEFEHKPPRRAILTGKPKEVLVIRDGEPELTLWSYGDDRIVSLVGHEKQIFGACKLPESGGFLTWGIDHFVRLWDAEWRPGKTLCHETTVYEARWLEPIGRIATRDGNGTVRIWSADGILVRKLPGSGHWNTYFGLLSDNHRILTWGSRRFLKIFELNEEPSGDGSQEDSPSFAGALISPEANELIVWGSSQKILTFDTETNARPPLIGHSSAIKSVLATGRGSLVSLGYDKDVRLWSLDRRSSALLDHDGQAVEGMRKRLDGNGLITWTYDGDCFFWNAQGELEFKFPTGIASLKSISALVGERSIVACGLFESRYFTLSEQNTVDILWRTVGTHGIVCLQSDRRILFAGGSRDLSLIDYDGNLFAKFEGHDHLVEGAAVLPGDERIISWDVHSNVCFWTKEGELLMKANLQDDEHRWVHSFRSIYTHDWPGCTLPLSNGNGVLTWTDWRVITHWSNQGERLRELNAHFGAIRGVIPIRDDKGFLSSAEDGMIVHWSPNFEVIGMCSPLSSDIVDVLVDPNSSDRFIVVESDQINRMSILSLDVSNISVRSGI